MSVTSGYAGGLAPIPSESLKNFFSWLLHFFFFPLNIYFLIINFNNNPKFGLFLWFYLFVFFFLTKTC